MSVHIIAEVGSVHDGSFGNATKLIELAAKSGADSVKFQTHIADAETTRAAPAPAYFTGEPRFAYFERTAFSRDQWSQLKACAEANRIGFLSSPFSNQAVDLLEDVGVDRYKIPSGEVTNLPLLAYVAQTKKPVLLSSGMSTWRELDAAVEAILCVHDRLTVLQCTSEYPCLPENVGLNIMMAMRERYRLPVGLSDHTLTLAAPIAAVTVGAEVIEKHFAFSRAMYGSDAKHSLEPAEFTAMVSGIREVETMLASVLDKDGVAGRLADMKGVFEKSVVTVAPLRAGAVIAKNDIAAKKPGTGIPAARLADVIGRKTARDLPADSVLQESDLVS